MSQIILAGDIGGTKTLLQVAEVIGEKITVLAEHRFDSQAYSSFDEVLAEFFRQPWVNNGQHEVTNACIGVAGPVKNHLAKVTNLPWELDSQAIAENFAINKVRLINDFQAVGYGIELLTEQDLEPLQKGDSQPQGVRAVIGAGTGLGHGILIWQQGRYEVLGSEGGHASFAPTNELQIELLQYLRNKYPYVSFELTCSGPGLENIYEFMHHKHNAQGATTLSAAAITQLAFNGEDQLAKQALQMFVEIYGAQAGNLALTCLATGGVYIAGGIAPKILAALKQGEFIQAFNAKSKMQSLLQSIPVFVVTNPKVGLLGTVAVAAYHM